MYKETGGPSPEEMESNTPDRRPSPDVRESAVDVLIIELTRQKAEILAAMGSLDAHDPASAIRAQELQNKLDKVNLELGKASVRRDAIENEQELRRLGGMTN